MDVQNYLLGGYKEVMGHILSPKNKGGNTPTGNYTWNDLKAFANIIKTHQSDFNYSGGYCYTGATMFVENIDTIENKFTSAGVNLNDYDTFYVLYRKSSPNYFYVYLIATGTPDLSGTSAKFNSATGYRLYCDLRYAISKGSVSTFTENISWNTINVFGLQNTEGLTYNINCNFENKYELYK